MTEDFGTIIGSLAAEPVVIPVLPDKLPVLTVTLGQFSKTTSDIVIPNLEGGYYHPDTKKNFSPQNQKKLGNSGETIFGEDRVHGKQLAKYPEWKMLWDLVDTERAKNPAKWKYNYMPDGEVGKELRRLTSAIMYKWFQYLAGKYILITSMDEIANDERLLIHFSYAAWNGEGWFERYANALNAAIRQYEGDKEMIFKTAIKSRTESSNLVIRQQGINMMQLFRRLKLV